MADSFLGIVGSTLPLPDAGPYRACWVPNPTAATIPNPLWQHLFSYMNVTLKEQTGIEIAWTTDCNNLVV